MPVPVERILEVDLRIELVPVPGLLKGEGIDALLLGDSLYVDQAQYLERSGRCRFTLAHELGHHLLHRGRPWRREHEWEANHFAASFLLPRERFRRRALSELRRLGRISGVSRSRGLLVAGLARVFGVSPQVAGLRLRDCIEL